MKKRILNPILAAALWSTQLATAEQAQKSEQPTETKKEDIIVKSEISIGIKETKLKSPEEYFQDPILRKLHLETKDPNKAEKLLEELIENDPANEIAHALYGRICLKKDEIGKAKEELIKGGELGLIWLSAYYIKQNDFVNAKIELGKVLTEDKKKQKQIYNLSIIKDEKPLYVQKATGDDIAEVYLTKIKVLEGKVDEAKSDFIKRFGENDELFEAFCLTGGVYFELNFELYYKPQPKERRLEDTI